MNNKKRTPKESAIVVEKTITEIRTVLGAVSTMEKCRWFNKKLFNETGFDELISGTCHKYDINEKHIRTVAGWRNKAPN